MRTSNLPDFICQIYANEQNDRCVPIKYSIYTCDEYVLLLWLLGRSCPTRQLAGVFGPSVMSKLDPPAAAACNVRDLRNHIA